MNYCRTLAVLCVVGALHGCATNPRWNSSLSPRHVTIHTEPSKAMVTQLRPLGLGSRELGVTPLINLPVSVMTKVKMKNMSFGAGQELIEHADHLILLIEKDGYEPYRANIFTPRYEPIEQTIKLTPAPKNE